MTVRVRFAPSPTGQLHIGGARTALYCYLYARATGGSFILRIEDTDQERSKKEYEVAQIEDLKWFGLDYDEGPDKDGGFGPYRQSERREIYNKYAWELVENGKAYPCFLTQDELDELTAKAESEKIAPHTYHGKYKDLPADEAKKKIDAGEEYVIRFKNPGKKWTFKDLVRGEVTFPEDMVGDFVIIRSNGLPVYNFCCVIDDHLMKISHVIRAEDHLNNTVRQLMVYEAIGADVPEFAHCSLLVGEDRQKLSKRHGATSVTQYRNEHYLPQALINYLCLLGWSHPEEKDIFDINQLGEEFDLSRFSKSPALYDIKKLNYFNEQHLRALPVEEQVQWLEKGLSKGSKYYDQSDEWKKTFATLFIEKIQLVSEIEGKLPLVFSADVSGDEDYKETLGWETTPSIAKYLKEELGKITEGSPSIEKVTEWMNYLKKELKIKGKPLFMGTRVVLTGQNHGPDLKTLVSLTPVDVLLARCEKALV
ncbi:MAG: glutamate--tRNA ligase [Bacteriovoracaceae bacterium]|nr:glutamate--tRNA ligase [Bacteriovoracaceae bacterium]